MVCLLTVNFLKASLVKFLWVQRKRSYFWALSTPAELEYVVRDGNRMLLLDRSGLPRYLFNLRSNPYVISDRLNTQADVAAKMQKSFRQIHGSVLKDMANWFDG